eukprot:scaffold34252_cov71-Phaeocystis_antarctica.AAC.1
MMRGRHSRVAAEGGGCCDVSGGGCRACARTGRADSSGCARRCPFGRAEALRSQTTCGRLARPSARSGGPPRASRAASARAAGLRAAPQTSPPACRAGPPASCSACGWARASGWRCSVGCCPLDCACERPSPSCSTALDEARPIASWSACGYVRVSVTVIRTSNSR